jgi:hypothetical protein
VNLIDDDDADNDGALKKGWIDAGWSTPLGMTRQVSQQLLGCSAGILITLR